LLLQIQIIVLVDNGSEKEITDWLLNTSNTKIHTILLNTNKGIATALITLEPYGLGSMDLSSLYCLTRTANQDKKYSRICEKHSSQRHRKVTTLRPLHPITRIQGKMLHLRLLW
jgi:hypothetical protein